MEDVTRFKPAVPDVTYEVISEGTERGKPKMVDSEGHTYTQKVRPSPKYPTVWICSVRSNHFRCPASVKQTGDEFTPNDNPHCHPPKPGEDLLVSVTAEAKRRSKIELEKSPEKIAKEILDEQLCAGHSPDLLPKMNYLVRHATNARKGLSVEGNSLTNRRSERKRKKTIDHDESFRNEEEDGWDDKGDEEGNSAEEENGYETKAEPQRVRNGLVTHPANNHLTTGPGDASAFYILGSGTQKGHPQLLDSLGHTYNRKCALKGGTIYWRCSVRSKTVKCSATVQQKGKKFIPGIHRHCHPRKINKLVDRQSETQEVETMPMVREVQTEQQMDDSLQDEVLEHPRNGIQSPPVSNRLREELCFPLETELIPGGFLRSDVKLNDARHLLFMSESQEALLRRVKTVYFDRTFKIVQKPFQQIFSIHAFVKGNRESGCRLVPLAFVLMTRRRRKDYAAVLRAVNEVIPEGCRSVVEAVMGYEIAVWQAVRDVYGREPVLRGCFYHWARAVWDRCLESHLGILYQSNTAIQEAVDKLMMLPLVPAEHVENTFIELQETVTQEPNLNRLYQYVESTWILGFWTAKEWSAHGNPIRLEADVEGWVNRVSEEAGRSPLPLPKLVTLLYRFSQVVGGQLRVADRAWVMGEQFKRCGELRTLYNLWNGLDEGNMEVEEFVEMFSGKINAMVWG